MLTAVDLDDELRGVRYEIDYIGTNRCLPPETCAIKAMRAKAVPDCPFRLRQVLPQRASAHAHLRLHAPFRRVAGSPLPTLPRKRGRGSVWLGYRFHFAVRPPPQGGRCTDSVARHPLNPPASVGKSSGRKP